ncbi:MAG: hypothetical protein ACYTKD_17870 [Planctomycetota bacterium]|jgi:hypothetical protein
MPHYDRGEREPGADGVFLSVVTGRLTGAVGVALMAVLGLVSFSVMAPHLPRAPDTFGVLVLAFFILWYGGIVVIGLVSLALAIRGRRIEVAVRGGALEWVDGPSEWRSGSAPVKDVRAVRAFYAAPDLPGGRPELECVMLDLAAGPTLLLPRNVARAAASEAFADFLKLLNPAAVHEARTISDARELNELRDRVIRMRATPSRLRH